jgi:DNA polymerase
MRDSVRHPLAAVWACAQAGGYNDLPPAAVDFETFYRTKKKAKAGLPVVSVEEQGNWGYCRQREWEAYMVSIYSPACPALGLPEIAYVGDPRHAPWAAIAGRVWLSHNRNFDRHVFERLCELGIVKCDVSESPNAAEQWGRQMYSVWHDTADLVVYCHLPRALAKCSALLFGLVLDKEARNSMDGVQWSEVPEAEKQRVLTYALEDAVLCCMLWLKLAPMWPEIERKASLHTGNIEFRGIPVDSDLVAQHISTLETALWQTRSRIPWVDTEDDKGKPVALRSKKALDRECLKCGVPAPTTTSQKAKEFLDWLDEYGDKVPAIYELARFRRIDRALSVYRALQARQRPDGRAALGLKYMGADKTGRWSGANKFNLQNIIKTPMAFVKGTFAWVVFDKLQKKYVDDNGATYAPDECHIIDTRACITASPGRKLIIADLSQIEPRVLNWIVGNTEFLKFCAAGMSPYEAHARASMGWTGGNLKKENPQVYALAKARVLALGYGAGWQKFIEMARGYLETEAEFLKVFGVTPSSRDTERFLRYLSFLVEKMNHKASGQALKAWPELDEQTRNIWVNSWVQVDDFRRTNPLIAGKENIARGTKAGLWERLDRDFRASYAPGADGVFENELPNGRVLKYFDCSPAWGGSSKPNSKMAIPSRTYGGLLTENCVQAIARDVFLNGVLNVEEGGYEVLFHVHDEIVVEAPADADREHVSTLLTRLPEWATGLPVAAESEDSQRYKK